MSKILVCGRYTQSSIAFLKSQLGEENILLSKDVQPTSEELSEVVGLLTRSNTKIDAETMAAAKDLKVVVTATSGYDHIDFDFCKKNNIAAMYTPDANKESAAQNCLLLALSLLRNSYNAQKTIENNKWKNELPLGQELSDKQWGIIGFGRIGRRVSELLSVFNINIVAYDPYVDESEFKNTKVTKLGLGEVLSTSDIISFHVPLTSETQNLINDETIEQMKDGVYLVNNSRGEVIDENALIDALKSKKVCGAALDVFNIEPLQKDSQLRNFENVIMTPHMGAYTEQAFELSSMMAIKKIIALVKNNEVTDPIPNKK